MQRADRTPGRAKLCSCDTSLMPFGPSPSRPWREKHRSSECWGPTASARTRGAACVRGPDVQPRRNNLMQEFGGTVTQIALRFRVNDALPCLGANQWLQGYGHPTVASKDPCCHPARNKDDLLHDALVNAVPLMEPTDGTDSGLDLLVILHLWVVDGRLQGAVGPSLTQGAIGERARTVDVGPRNRPRTWSRSTE